ncbi:MAG: N,N'-diacetylchitobiose phosphorylase, partial [Lachnospiraceae bacterium]|nr:N,N'-diacetylchitobiose phosphorylase [Lachnospiraceae bacterium]
MQFGHFDDEAYEYVVDRPDTPTSWSNYLGTTEYGAIITNNAGGYGFYRSGAQGRFMRLRFNSVPMDQPGRYFYLRDNDTKDYWSASWQPVGKPLDQYKTVCRHGTAYSIFSSDYSGIHTDATYFVPLGQKFEYWRLDVENKSDKPRNLSAFTYCEFASQWNTTQDLVNLQYSLFIMEADKKADNILGYSIHDNMYKQHPEYELGGIIQQEWFAVCEAPMTHYDTNREKFIGTYGSYKEPRAVIEGQCSDSWTYGDTACGSIQSDMVLQPGEKKTVLILLGIGNANAVGEKIVAEYGSAKRFD